MIFRIVRLLLVLGLCAALVVFAKPMDLLQTSSQSAATYEVSAKDLEVNCMSAAVISGGSTGTSTTNFRRTSGTMVSASYSAAESTTLSIFGKEFIQGFGVRQDLAKKIVRPNSLTVLDKTGKVVQGSALLTANHLQLITNKRISGLLGAPCIRPQSEFWFVGGTTTVGREALLLLHNPSKVDATVDLEIFTENGTSHSAGLSGIAVPHGKTTVLPLSAFVLRASSISVHVLSHGGSITALIQQKTVRGLFANGADFIAPTETLETKSYFPGLLVRGSQDAAQYRKTAKKYSDVQNMLRVYVPGNTDAKLTLQILGSDSESFGTVLSITAPAGKVTDFDIKGLEDGDYFGILDSDVPVRSAIRLVRAGFVGDRFADFTWINAAASFSSERFIAVPTQGISKLSLVNLSSQPTKVTLKIGSATVTRRIAGTSSIVVRATAGLSIGIVPTSAIGSNLLVDVRGRIATLPVLDDKNISGTVKVSVH